MIALRTALRPPRLVAAAAALTVCLAGCSGGGESQGEQGDQQQSASAPAEGGADQSAAGDEADAGDTGATAEASSGADGSGSAPTTPSTNVSERFKDSAKTTSWASDDSMKVDKKGNGTIPEKSLEFDLKDLFVNKFEMKVSKVDCTRKMNVNSWRGSTLCNVTANGKTYFGSVKLIDHRGDMVRYQLIFPGMNKKDLKLD